MTYPRSNEADRHDPFVADEQAIVGDLIDHGHRIGDPHEYQGALCRSLLPHAHFGAFDETGTPWITIDLRCSCGGLQLGPTRRSVLDPQRAAKIEAESAAWGAAWLTHVEAMHGGRQL